MKRTMRRQVAAVLAAWLGAPLASCGSAERTITIGFEGRVADRAFECGSNYDGVGRTRSTLTPLDLRFYVHDVRVLTADGEEHPLQLVDDGVWQNGGVAMLDFETGGSCEGGNASTNRALVGTVPGGTGPVTGLRFRLGVPAARNHLDAATAPSPLNLTAMFWGWQAGYKYLRFEGRSTGQPAGFRFHLGATGCSGDARDGTRTCTAPNVPDIALDAFDPARDVVVADLVGLFSTSDIDTDGGGSPGCMADEGDPECAVLFEAVGLDATSSQSFFRAEPRTDVP